MIEDEEVLCDEYRSYMEWIKRENKPFSSVERDIYAKGYAAGFVEKLKIFAKEQLQK